MTYRELLNLYKEGKLAEAQAEKVKKDIERQEAISDYLLDEGELESEAFAGALEMAEDSESFDDTSAEFAKMINGSIKRAFRKVGITVFAVTLIVILFIQFALPNIVDLFYYDPGKVIGEGDNASNRMSLDMSVFSELEYPLDYYRYVTVNDRGYGNYDIQMSRGYGFGKQKMVPITGKIEKGKKFLYNEQFIAPAGNSFKWNEVEGYMGENLTEFIGTDVNTPITEFYKTSKPYGETVADAHDYNREILSRLNDGDLFICYVTPTRQMKYEDFRKFTDENKDIIPGNGWCAVRVNEAGNYPLYGFQYDPFCSTDLEWDKEKYPNLLLWPEPTSRESSDEEEELLKTEEYAKTHFLSMLNYLNDNQKFTKMMYDTDYIDYSYSIDYVKKNGLTVYGFAVIATKEQAMKMLELEDIYYISAEPLY